MTNKHETMNQMIARLKVGEHFPEVKLAGCLIGKTCIPDVVKPLRENVHVRHVDLSSNGLSEFGATQIANVLKTSLSLRTLSICGTVVHF
mmetsp:Transcript_67570/g.180590  ORF Transcript_67570/g.180590 Transcript_67570/m.180590 type:complete len:90 (+) Transcript_67570:134-403(+)